MSLEAKEAAVDASVALNYAAAALAGAAAVTAFIPGGQGAAVVFGVGSAAAWWIGTEYSDLAADPPRTDYHLVTKFAPRKVELPAPKDEIDAIWNECNRVNVRMADTISALIVSLERLQGARLDLRKPGADADWLAGRIAIQRKAVRHNAAAARDLIRALIKLRSRVNAAWSADAGSVRAIASDISAEERQQAAAALWAEIRHILGDAVGSRERLDTIQKPFEEAARAAVEVPDELLDQRWSRAMASMERQLARLAGERAIRRASTLQAWPD